MSRTTTLHDGWTLAVTAPDAPSGVAGRSLPAQVPGTVHTDLLHHGLIPDPYAGAAEEELTWLHRADCRYARPTTLAPAAEGERVDLVLEGVDTVAVVALGGRELGRTANMHRSHRFDVRDLADGVERDLVVDITAATTHAEAERDRLGARPAAYSTPYPYVRKMACSFGWDWGPDLRTAGLWKPVVLHRWRTARLARVRPLVDVTADGTGRIDLHVDLELSGLAEPRELRVRAAVLGREAVAVVPAGATSARLLLEVPDAPLWWPVGMGAQPLVDLEVTLLDGTAGDAGELDSWRRRTGFRTVELVTDEDGSGTSFVVRVNGRPVFVRGANWIPDDHLLTRTTRDDLAARFDQALGANLNLLRVWGGGVYESEDFYELADERGLMVWQDFLLACAAYPEEEPLASELEAEARENVARLVPHPSLVLWNGGNENLWGHEDWGWKEQLHGRTWGGGYATELLRRVVAEVDPTRPYHDNSPSSPGRDAADVHPNHPDHGTHHEWDVWNRRDWSHYRDDVPRFCSEFGFQGPPTWRTLADSVPAVDGRPLEDVDDALTDPVWLVHQKAEDGNGKLDRGMAPHVGVPASFTDWTWAAQLVQARAVRHAVEHYRSWWPRTAGAVVWQLNDCWPVTSWAAVDGPGRVKPLWFALRRAFADRTVSFTQRPDGLNVAVVNDTDEVWDCDLAVRRESTAGAVLAGGPRPVRVAPRSVLLHPLEEALTTPGDPRAEVLTASTGDGSAVVHAFVEDVDLALDPGAARVEVERVEDGYVLRVDADSLVRDLVVHVDRVHADAVADDGMLTLPAGARARVHVTCPPVPDPGAFTRSPVLRTANDLRAVPQSPRAATALWPGAGR